MENPQQIEAPEIIELKEKAAIQIAIIRSFMRRKIIKVATEYVDNGYAEAFEMFWQGWVRTASEQEVSAMRTQVETLKLNKK